MSTETSDDTVITSLKIQVDNDISLHRNNDIEDEVEEGEATETESEDEVEVNVIVDSHISDSYEPKVSSDNRTTSRKNVKQRNDENLRNFVQKESYYKPKMKSLTYAHSDISSIEQDFGSDLPSPVGMTDKKMEERALRFGNTTSNNSYITKADWLSLWQSLDLTSDDFHRGGFRAEAIHMRGIENLKSKEIFEYFQSYSPHNIEWLNKDSCNVVFSKKEKAAKALIELSCPIIDRKRNIHKGSIQQPEPSLMRKPQETVTEIPMKKATEMPMKKATEMPMEKATEKLKQIKISKKVKKKNKKNEKSGSDSDSSSEESSSSDSEDEGSSSDSSTSSSSSSSSDSSSESSSDSSSSSSSSSESEDDDDDNEDDDAKSSENKSSGEEKNNNSAAAVPMDIDDTEEKSGRPSVSIEEVGVNIPSGRWRLGVPCPNALAILLRYAHCKDKKMPGIEKPVDFYEDYIKSRSKKTLEQERHRIQKELTDLDKRHRKRESSDKKSRSKRSDTKRERKEKIIIPEVGGNYIDLDDPYDDGKNPWGFLAQNWDRKETQDSLDYQALLHQHITGQKRKRRSDTETDDEELHPAKYISRHRSRHKKSFSEEDFNSCSEEESDDQGDLYDDIDWRSKIKLPRMRMYADSVERKKGKRNNDKQVKMRIRRSNQSVKGRLKMDSIRNINPVFDLRNMLLRNRHKK